MVEAYGSSSADAVLASKLTSQKSNRLFKNIGSFFTRFKRIKSIFPARRTAAFDEDGKRTKETKPEIFLFEKQPRHTKAQRMLEAIERAVNSENPNKEEIERQIAKLFKGRAMELVPQLGIPVLKRHYYDIREAIHLLAHSLFLQEKTPTNDLRMELLGILARKYTKMFPRRAVAFDHDVKNWSIHMRHYKGCDGGIDKLKTEIEELKK